MMVWKGRRTKRNQWSNTSRLMGVGHSVGNKSLPNRPRGNDFKYIFMSEMFYIGLMLLNTTGNIVSLEGCSTFYPFKNNASLILLVLWHAHTNTLLVFSGCRQVVQHYMMYYTVSRECVVKVYVEWLWGRKGRGRGDTWIIARTLGIKFIFYPDRPSVSPCRIWLGLLISICMEASSFSPEGVRGNRGVLWFKRQHLSHLLRHPKGQPCEGEKGKQH